MQARQISNPTRGCGKLRKGMCYARGETGYGGTLSPASFVGGKNYGIGDERGNLFFDMPARKMLEIDLGMTLLYEQFIDWPAGEINRDRLAATGQRPAAYAHLMDIGNQRQPGYALCDHVGTEQQRTGGKGYTPWSFMHELELHGPNRAIPPYLAKALAGKGAIPVLFTASQIPFFADQEHAKWFMDTVVIPFAQEHEADGRHIVGEYTSYTDFCVTPTWQNPRWNLKAHGYTGDDHYLLPALWYIHETGDVTGIETMEAPLCVSWFTSIVYTMDGPNDPQAAEMADAGIEPVWFE